MADCRCGAQVKMRKYKAVDRVIHVYWKCTAYGREKHKYFKNGVEIENRTD